MNATQEPPHNVNPPKPPDPKPSASAEHQRRYRDKVRRKLQAFDQIKEIVARVEDES